MLRRISVLLAPHGAVAFGGRLVQLEPAIASLAGKAAFVDAALPFVHRRKRPRDPQVRR